MSARFIAACVAVVIAVIVIFSSIYTVDQGEEAVILTFGKVAGTETAGLHFKVPFVQDVKFVTLQSHTRAYDSTFESYSKDQQPADILASVNWHVPPGSGAQVYAMYGGVDNMLTRVVDQYLPAILKDVFGTYDAQTAIQQRARLNADVLAALEAQASAENQPIVFDSVQLKDIKYRPEYEAAISAKQSAVVEVQKREQELAQQRVAAEITVTNAQAEADSQLAKAKAAAEAIKVQGEAEAAAIRAKGDALKDNPQLVDLTKAERWNGVLPTTVLPAGTVPFLDVGAAH